MTLVDSSVWIDWFRGTVTRETSRLDELLRTRRVALGDLNLVEILQGFASDREFNQALRLLSGLDVVTIGGSDLAVRAARNFRTLRSRGVTVRKTIDTLIATRCIALQIPLLYSDRDFDPFVEHLGLRSAMVTH